MNRLLVFLLKKRSDNESEKFNLNTKNLLKDEDTAKRSPFDEPKGVILSISQRSSLVNVSSSESVHNWLIPLGNKRIFYIICDDGSYFLN